MTAIRSQGSFQVLEQAHSNYKLLSPFKYQKLLSSSLKRILDILVSSILLIVFFPILLCVAILIALDSPGSIIFVQERVGCKRRYENGKYHWEVRNFKMYKFRSMTADTDPHQHRNHIKSYISGDNEHLGEGTPKLKGNMTVTRIGRFIRKTSLDELPQLVNVIKGEMSLVGPRPVPTYEVEEYQPPHFERLCALPGITGLWQVKGRCNTTFDEQIRMDVEYVRNQSLLLDLKILILTIPAVISGSGAA